MRSLNSDHCSQIGSASLDQAEKLLIGRVLAGEKEEFRKLIEAHQTQIFSVIMKLVGNRSISEELALETFERAYFNLRSFKFKSTFRTWLTRIAFNLTNSYFASAQYRNSIRTESFSIDQHDFSSNAKNSSERREYFTQFYRAIGSLSPKLRDVLCLCGLNGASYEEAAETLQIPIGTVRSRLNQARQKLREKLEGLGIW